MFSKLANKGQGYEENRFQRPVSGNFKCAICFNVLNTPKGCRNNQHYFCCGCISKHLVNFHTCPSCMDKLTAETLVEPPRVLLNCILELPIKCCYDGRGCPDYVQLGNLQTHVDKCGFAPTNCVNEGCGIEINRQNKLRHETELCKFRKMECRGCGELKKKIEEIRRNQEKANQNMEEQQREMSRKLAEMNENQGLRIKESIKEVLIGSLDNIENVSLPTQDLQTGIQDVYQPPQRFGPTITHDVLVMGGEDADGEIIASVERYCCKEGRWIELAPMTMPRSSASSVVFDNQIIVSGGETKVPDNPEPILTDSIEILNLDKSPFTWVTSVAKLPLPVADHVTLIYKGKLIVICDDKRREERESKIFEVQLAAPHSTRELYTLPRLFYGTQAQLVDERIFLFGGTISNRNLVLVYDLVSNDCRKMAGLPSPLTKMSSVLWREKVIILGGLNMYTKGGGWEREHVDDVLMYDTETGESEVMPPMKHERGPCSAVLTDEVIIVIGGHYNTVEFYDFRTNTWQAFRAMNECRSLATAVVSPV